MKKTSVYLTEDEAADLRRLAVREGRPQAELIREGLRRLIADSGPSARQFRSLGRGRGGGQPYSRPDPERLYERKMGNEKGND